MTARRVRRRARHLLRIDLLAGRGTEQGQARSAHHRWASRRRPMRVLELGARVADTECCSCARGTPPGPDREALPRAAFGRADRVRQRRQSSEATPPQCGPRPALVRIDITANAQNLDEFRSQRIDKPDHAVRSRPRGCRNPVPPRLVHWSGRPGAEVAYTAPRSRVPAHRTSSRPASASGSLSSSTPQPTGDPRIPR